MRVHHHPAYVLLNRPYTETSWIVEVFSREYGRFALIAKGARRIKSRLKGVLLPFQPLLLSWTGKGEVPTLISAEIDQDKYDFTNELVGDALVCGFYCNELITNLLHRHDPHLALFDRYHSTIMALSDSASDQNMAYPLRDFEKAVMRETGYEVSFEFEADGRTKIEDDVYYHFQPNQGFVRASLQPDYPVYFKQVRVQGYIIKAMAQDESDLSAHELSMSKHLMRDILTQILGARKIVSRNLFFPKELR